MKNVNTVNKQIINSFGFICRDWNLACSRVLLTWYLAFPILRDTELFALS